MRDNIKKAICDTAERAGKALRKALCKTKCFAGALCFKKAARLAAQCAYMPLMIVYMETLLRLLTGSEHWQGFPFSVLFALSAGFLINLVMAIVNNGRINRIIGAALLGILGVVFALQYFMYQSFKVFMNFNSIITEAGNVIGVFTNTLITAIYRGMPVILGFLAPFILFLVFTGKRLPLLTLCEETPPRDELPEDAPWVHKVFGFAQSAVSALPVTVAASGLVLTIGGQVLLLSVSENDKTAFYSEYNFNASSRRLGVLPGACLDIWYGAFGSPLDIEAFSLSEAQDMPAFEIPVLPPAAEADVKPTACPRPPFGQTAEQEPGPDTGQAPDSTLHTPNSTLSAPGPEPEPTPEPVVYGYNAESVDYNALDIDFEMLIEGETDSRRIDMHRYVSALTPSRKNAYTGLFEGKNLIIFCAEAFTKQVVDPVMTPTLYRLVHNGFYFSDFYQPAWGGGTSGGEYAILSGFPPTDSGSMLTAANQNCSYMIGNRLRNIGYFSASYHNGSYTYYNRHESHEKIGYDTFQAVGFGIDGYERLRWSASDLEMLRLSIPHYIYNRPFSVYYMTVSGHSPYTFSNQVANRNWNAFPEQFSEMSDPIRAYYAANLELEYALEYLVNQLEIAGIADDTVIVLATDHFPYGLERSATWESDGNYLEELFGTPVKTDVERDESAMILWSGCLENEYKDMAVEISSPTMTLDILPTLLNLFGLEFDSRLFVGRDVFSDAVPLVFWYSRSWKTDAGFFDTRRNEFTPASSGITITEEYRDAVRAVVNNKIRYSNSVLSRDYFNTIFDYDGTLRTEPYIRPPVPGTPEPDETEPDIPSAEP